MKEQVVIEWKKIRRIRALWFFVAGTPLLAGLLAWSIGAGLQPHYSLTGQADPGWSLWHSASTVFFIGLQLIATTFAVNFLLSWQQQEHLDNTFKLYDILPSSLFGATVLRFAIFYFLCSLIFAIAIAGGAKLLELSLAGSFPEYHKSIGLDGRVLRYWRDGAIAFILLSMPFYLAMYAASLKSNRISVTAVMAVALTVAGFLSLPGWLFFRSVPEALRILRNLYGGIQYYSLSDLYRVYAWSLGWTAVLMMMMFYLAARKKLFQRIT